MKQQMKDNGNTTGDTKKWYIKYVILVRNFIHSRGSDVRRWREEDGESTQLQQVQDKSQDSRRFNNKWIVLAESLHTSNIKTTEKTTITC